MTTATPTAECCIAPLLLPDPVGEGADVPEPVTDADGEPVPEGALVLNPETD